MSVAKKMTKTLTSEQWYMIIDGLRSLEGEQQVQELADELAADMATENASVDDDFEANFRPTPDQILWVRWYAKKTHIESVFVAVNFPGKQRGIWNKGQAREAVLNANSPVFWTNRDKALEDLDTGQVGNAIFRVWADGRFGLVDER